MTGKIKGNDQPYTPGARSWLKLKHRETVEIICEAVIGPITEPREVVAGLVLDGELRIVGRSTPLKTAAARELERWLQPPRGAHPWPTTVQGTTRDRFNRDKEPVTLTLVEPVAVEVSADTAWSGRSFRHPLHLVRARPELSPAVPDHDGIGAGQIQDGLDAQGVEPFGQPRGDTPDLNHGQAAHQ
ncbi:ATP-dependent DNA ligase [Arthrobacter sp. LAR12-1-1.1]